MTRKGMCGGISLLLCLWGALAYPAEKGGIRGRVVDDHSGQPLIGVNVLIEGTTLGATTNAEGLFRIAEVPIGTHRITFRMIGYQSRTLTNVLVMQHETTAVDVKLQVQPIELGGAEITAHPYFYQPSDAPVSTTTLDIGEIRTQPSGSYDIQRAIQVIPSVVSQSDGLNEIIIRGGNFGENLFVIDDIELDNPNHFAFPSSGGGPVSMITPDMVRELTFYGGAFPSRYGDKTSSVLDITLRDGDEKQFKAQTDLSMAGYGGSIEGPLFSEKSSYLCMYHRSFLSLVSNSIGLSAVPNYQSFMSKQVFHLSKRHTLTLNQFFGNDWIDISHDDMSAYTSSARYEDIYNRSGQHTLGMTLRTVYAGSTSRLTLYRNYRWWENDIYQAETKDNANSLSRYHSQESRNTLRYSHKFLKTAIGDVELGMQLKYDVLQADIFRRPDTTFTWDPATGEMLTKAWIDTISPANTITSRIEAEKVGGYFQWEKQARWFQLNAGIRYDYFSWIDRASFAPTFGLKVPLPIMAYLRFGFGRYYQTPDYLTLSYNVLNKQLKPKYTDQVVLGMDLLLSDEARARIEGYYKKYEDVPVNYAMATSDPYDWHTRFVSTGRGNARGIELLFQRKEKNNWWSTVSYAYSIAKAFDPRYPEQKITYNWDFDYRNIFTAVLGYKFKFLDQKWYQEQRRWLKFLGWLFLLPSDQTEISMRFRYMGGSPYTQMTLHKQYNRWYLMADQPINADRIPDYNRLDLHIHHHLFEKRFTLVGYIEVNNIFNHKNIWKYNFVNAQNLLGSRAVRETTYQWGRTVVGGVKIEL